MCGILGLVGPLGQGIPARDAEILAMRDAMSERGPDDAGFFRRENVAFAHRLLSIRDLQSGRQPWVSQEANCVLVYNGELYNDRELRQELVALGHRFRSRSCDTEVILAAYQEWGTDCLSRFRGMFAFGIYDFTRRQLFLARDRFGVKPLFFTMVGNTLVFASSVAAILRHPHISKSPNWPAVSHYLTTFRITLGGRVCTRELGNCFPANF